MNTYLEFQKKKKKKKIAYTFAPLTLFLVGSNTINL